MAQTWYYTNNGQRLGPILATKLKELAMTGQLQPNDLVWKEGMAQWASAHQIKGLFAATNVPPSPPPTTEVIDLPVTDLISSPPPVHSLAVTSQQTIASQDHIPGVVIADLGEINTAEFSRCRERLRQAQIADQQLVLFGSSKTRRKPSLGKSLMNLMSRQETAQPLLHVAITPRELLIVDANGDENSLVRLAWESLSWQLAAESKSGLLDNMLSVFKAKSSPTESVPTETLTIKDINKEYRLEFNAGPGLDIFRQRLSQMCYERAQVWFSTNKCGLAAKMLAKVAPDFQNYAAVEDLQSEIGILIQITAEYQGGHPELVQKATGTLCLHARGIEFIIAQNESDSLVVSYEYILEVLEPQRGAHTKEMQKAVESQKRSADSTATMSRFAGQAMANQGHQLAGNLVASQGAASARNQRADATLGPIPTNRLAILLLLDGVKHKVIFDVVGGLREQIEEQARLFWTRTARVRNQFRKAIPLAPRAQLTTPSPLGSTSPELVDDGSSAAQELKQSLLPQSAKAPIRPQIVGCPKCSAKLRTQQPGIIQCPRCQTKIRVAATLFNKL